MVCLPSIKYFTFAKGFCLEKEQMIKWKQSLMYETYNCSKMTTFTKHVEVHIT